MPDSGAVETSPGGLIQRLGRLGVTPIARDLRITGTVRAAPGADADGAPPPPGRDGDHLISCLMVTSGDRFSIPFAIECFRRQLYANRELVVVTYRDRVHAVAALLAEGGLGDTEVHGVGRDLSLGDMRNVAVARSRGDILVQWDDDDLYDPGRLAIARGVLMNSPAAAAMLRRVLIWWPQQALAAVSVSRLWENSIAVWRRDAPVYPSLNRLEDTYAVNALRRSRPVARCDLPLVYVYVVHGANTCESEHFQAHVRQAACVLRGAEYEELVQLLAKRMPILGYRDAVPVPPAAQA